MLPFIGTGNLSASLSGLDSSGVAGDNIIYNAISSGGGAVTLVYDYTPVNAAVPEPLTILGAMTALGLGTSLKRKLK